MNSFGPFPTRQKKISFKALTFTENNSTLEAVTLWFRKKNINNENLGFGNLKSVKKTQVYKFKERPRKNNELTEMPNDINTNMYGNIQRSFHLGQIKMQ